MPIVKKKRPFLQLMRLLSIYSEAGDKAEKRLFT